VKTEPARRSGLSARHQASIQARLVARRPGRGGGRPGRACEVGGDARHVAQHEREVAAGRKTKLSLLGRLYKEQLGGRLAAVCRGGGTERQVQRRGVRHCFCAAGTAPIQSAARQRSLLLVRSVEHRWSKAASSAERQRTQPLLSCCVLCGEWHPLGCLQQWSPRPGHGACWGAARIVSTSRKLCAWRPGKANSRCEQGHLLHNSLLLLGISFWPARHDVLRVSKHPVIGAGGQTRLQQRPGQ
jgi:hypothetical protein